MAAARARGVRSADALPDHLEPRLRSYLAALVPSDRVDDLLAQLLDEPPSADPVELFRAAHELVHEVARVSVDVEADVLVHDVAVSIDDASAILGVDPAEVRAAVDIAEEIAAELSGKEPVTTPSAATVEDAAPATPTAAATEDQPPTQGRTAQPPGSVGRHAEEGDTPSTETAPRPVLVFDDVGGVLVEEEQLDGEDEATGPLRPRRRWRLLVAAVTLIAAIALVIAVVPDRQPVVDAVNLPVTVSDAMLTSAVDAAGRPGEPQRRFEAGEPVVLWLAYELHDDPPPVVTFVVARDGQEISYEVELPERSDLSQPLPARHIAEPDDYRLEVRYGGNVLLRRDFVVASDS